MAEDQFERYYAEKLWEMIPAIYRHEDGLAERPGVLRALVEVLAEQAAILRRSQDRLWDDQFIELCNDWAVPYIADLVGTRLVSDLNKRGRRVDVAKTIYYRRRKGTLRVLEELISDISGWEGKIVEQFTRLARSRHRLDPYPTPLAGRYSGTPPGGWADLRKTRPAEISESPFDEFFHTPDVRKNRGRKGLYNIPKLAVHLFRLHSFSLKETSPFSLGDGVRFTFDPSGRDIPLFIRRNRPSDYDWEAWRSANEWELPAPIACRLLGHAEYRISEAAVQILANDASLGLTNNAVSDLRTLSATQFRDEAELRAMVATLPTQAELLAVSVFQSILRLTIIEDCGKQALLPNAFSVDGGSIIEPDAGSLSVQLSANIITAENCTSANLSGWSLPPINKLLAIDPENGRFMFTGAPVSADALEVSYHYGFSGNIGAGSYDRRVVEDSQPTLPPKSGGGAISVSDISNNGVAELADSKTYGPLPDKNAIQNLTLQAANGHRPYLQLDSNWRLTTVSSGNAALLLDGLWVGSKGNQPCEIVLRGNYECVTIRHCTFDPGGSSNALGETLHPLRLVVEGFVEQMCIHHSIMGPISTRLNGTIGTLSISDSIIHSVLTDTPAITLNSGMLEMERVTIFGQIDVHRLYASEVIVTQNATVEDTQTGCFRFSSAPMTSRLPRPYESFLFETDNGDWFTARHFGHPGYGQLSDVAPLSLQRGAENRSEMGAFNNLFNSIKSDDLRTKIDEYMPFGLIPIFIHKT